MKIRFRHENIKVLVTRISGSFNIELDAENNLWDSKFSKGSFRILTKELYDKILMCMAKMYDVDLFDFDIFCPTERKYGVERSYRDTGRIYSSREYSNLIFDIRNGTVVDVNYINPKQRICEINANGKGRLFLNTILWPIFEYISKDKYDFMILGIVECLISDYNKKTSPHKNDSSRKENNP